MAIFDPEGFTVSYFQAATGQVESRPASSDPLQRAAYVRELFALWKGDPCDCYLQSCGVFDFSTAALAYPGCKCAGLGREVTINKSSWFDWGSGTREAFQLGNGSVVEDVSLNQAALDETVDGICCGFPADNISATLRRVKITGREWGLYSWYPNSVAVVEDFTITAGRVCVAADDSGLGQTFTLRHGQIIGDASLSKCSPSYDVSNPRNGGIFGLVARGGTTTLQDVDISIKGIASLPRAVGITDVGGDNTQPAGNTWILHDGLRIQVEPNGAPSWGDIDLQFDYVRRQFKARRSL